MTDPWVIHRLMVDPREIHGRPMGDPWTTYGLPMGDSWAYTTAWKHAVHLGNRWARRPRAFRWYFWLLHGSPMGETHVAHG